MIGMIYEHGLAGEQRNKQMAIHWYRKGVEDGCQRAKEQLEAIGEQ